jgi:transcriptional regulator with XRE-family HTH domain
MEHRIKELIREKGYMQKEIAEKLGISVERMSKIVNGKPSYPTLENIARALDAEMWELFATREEVLAHPHTSIHCPYCGSKFELK